MTPLAALILGIVQGLTEFLPVSSSAHLALIHWAFGWTSTPAEDLMFDVAVHFGTLVAILAYFGRDWVSFLRRRDRMVAYVVVGCLPGALAGAVLEDKAATIFRYPLQIAVLLAAMGLVLAAAERWGRRERPLEQMGWADTLWVGVLQALAIMPGVSRAGITMTTGLFRGLTREAAARFSFLLGAPIILGAAIYEMPDALRSGLTAADLLPFGVGIAASAVVGYLCIGFLMSYLRTRSTGLFVGYRLVFGTGIILLSLLR